MEPVIYYTQGCDVLTTIGGLHQFMKWDRPLLTVCFQFSVLERYFGSFLLSFIIILTVNLN